MGQTLTHGVYLPDEGERNCYSGLASNWSILDNSVGTIAEHTTALAGKAPAVHTHVKADITDFPAYGNTAGTICEGNDSRLSDARTPVAHTHTKSDVTDLLNSNFIPSANNSYDLGSSSYQWDNVYSKNYFYNGVAWGLDRANVWGNSQTVTGNDKGWNVINPDLEKGVIPSAAKSSFAWWGDKNNTYLGRICSRVQADGTTILWLSSLNYYKNGALDPTGNSLTTSLILGVDANAYRFIQANADFIPAVSNIVNLGTSTAKWKSLNGINPGALSLPDNSKADPIDFSQWNVSGGFGNAYTPVSNGWLHINIKDTATNSIFVFATNKYSASVYGNGSQGLAGRLALMMPVLSGVTYAIIITAGSVSEIYTAKFIPCQGNV